MDEIRWGIVGCGDVTEKKSGPAFSKVPGSRLVAVMRRDAAKAADYARRHRIPQWYDNAAELIECPDVNAVYIATPPGSHAELALQVAKQGKPCYVEKPMARNFTEAARMTSAFAEAGVPLFIAYYRRALPRFRKIQSLLQQEALGKIREVNYRQCNNGNVQTASGSLPWRFQPDISGGGLFIDLGSHTLDLLDYWFGPLQLLQSRIDKNNLHPEIEDHVSMDFKMADDVQGNASWDFTESDSIDSLEIIGSHGKIQCSVFGHEPLSWTVMGKSTQELPFAAPEHIQQPLIAEVVTSLLHGTPCCSTGSSAQRTNAVMDQVFASSRA